MNRLFALIAFSICLSACSSNYFADKERSGELIALASIQHDKQLNPEGVSQISSLEPAEHNSNQDLNTPETTNEELNNFKTSNYEIKKLAESSLALCASDSTESVRLIIQVIEIAVSSDHEMQAFIGASAAQVVNCLDAENPELAASVQMKVAISPSVDIQIAFVNTTSQVAQSTATTATTVPTAVGSVVGRGGYLPPEPSAYPVLGWPLPTPSTRTSLSGLSSYFSKKNSSFLDVYSYLQRKLAGAGYSELAVHEVETGFIIVTRLEQLNKAQIPKKGSRWLVGQKVGFLKALEISFTGYRGHYRHMVFVISKPFQLSGHSPLHEQIEATSKSGWNTLPDGLENTIFGNQHGIEVLVYQFERNEDSGKMYFVTSSEVDAATQLEKTNIMGLNGIEISD